MENKIEYSEARGYNLGVARELGLPAAVVYNQLIFWQKHAKDDWFYKSYEDMEEEVPLSISTIRRAYDVLKQAGYIETALRKANGSPTLHFRICRIAQMESVNLNKTESVNLTETINNKTHNKTQVTDLAKLDSTTMIDVRKAYRLYLKYFIVTPDIPLAAAERRYKLTPKRVDAVTRRLKDAGAKMIWTAIAGFGRANWSNGNNDRRWKADLADFICKNYETVERGARLYEDQQNNVDSDDAWAKL